MIRRFLKDSLLYTVANLFTRGIGFILLPIYVRVISKEEYGLFDYLTTIGLILGVIVALEITQAIYRFMPEYKRDRVSQIKIASTGFWFTLFMYVILCLFVFVFSNTLALVLLDNSAYLDLVKITSILFLSNAVLYNFTSLMRANLLSKQVVIVSMFNAMFVATFSLIFVIYFNLGITGLISGQLLGVSLSIFVAFYWVRSWIKFVFCIKSLKEMLKFSTPLVFSSIGVILSMLVDRVMIKEFLGAEQLASYAVAIKLASIVTLLMVGFQSALSPLIYTYYKKNETSKKIAQLFHFYLLAALVFILLLSWLANWLVMIVAGEQYIGASDYVSPLVISALISSMYLFFPGLSIAKKTFFVAIINVFSGLLSLGLNYTFIPIYGALGAALSTLFSVSVAFVISAFIAQRFYKIPINKKLTLCVFISIVSILFVSVY